MCIRFVEANSLQVMRTFCLRWGAMRLEGRGDDSDTQSGMPPLADQGGVGS